MHVAAVVAEDEAIALAQLHDERLGVRPGLAVDGPTIEAVARVER
jgi:hypothetical protein